MTNALFMNKKNLHSRHEQCNKVKEEEKTKQPRKPKKKKKRNQEKSPSLSICYLEGYPSWERKRKEKISRVENKTLMSRQRGFAVPQGKNIENEMGPIVFVTGSPIGDALRTIGPWLFPRSCGRAICNFSVLSFFLKLTKTLKKVFFSYLSFFCTLIIKVFFKFVLYIYIIS